MLSLDTPTISSDYFAPTEHSSRFIAWDYALGVQLQLFKQKTFIITSFLRRKLSQAGAPADLCVFDPATTWRVAPETLQSRSSNSPWLGQELRGRVRLTVAAGRIAWDDLA